MIGYDNLTVITELTKRFFIRAAMNQHYLDAASSRLTLDPRLPADRVYRPHECFDREGVAEKRNAGKPGRANEGDLRCGGVHRAGGIGVCRTVVSLAQPGRDANR